MPNTPIDITKWKCPKCGELHEEAFDQCWNCLTSKPPNPDIVLTKQTPYASPLMITNPRIQPSKNLINNGIWIAIISGITWFILSGIASSIMITTIRYPSLPSQWNNQHNSGVLFNIDTSFNNIDALFMLSILASISMTGILVGVIMVILGYTRLFLKKQSTFEQHVNQQLHILARDNVKTIVGRGSMNDKTHISHSSIFGSAIGSSAELNAHNISIFQNMVNNSSNIDSDMKEKINLACTEIEKLSIPQEDKCDAIENIEKLTKELDKLEPDPGRVKRFLNHIKEIAPTVSSILMSAKKIIELII